MDWFLYDNGHRHERVRYKPHVIYFYWSSRPDVFCEKVVLKNFAKFTDKHLSQSFFFNKVVELRQACNFIKKETLAQVFSF